MQVLPRLNKKQRRHREMAVVFFSVKYGKFTHAGSGPVRILRLGSVGSMVLSDAGSGRC